MDKRVLVIGGGIGGVQAALDLANMGIKVTLVEEKPSIGGRMAQLDKTFPTNDCSTCILSPKLVELASHPNVTIYSHAAVEQVDKREHGFTVRIRERARFVNADKCTGCGMCSEKCPVKIPDEFNKEIAVTTCIGIPYAQAVPAVYLINKEHCIYLTKGKCGLCAKVCPSGAVEYDQQDQLVEEDAAAVIIAAGAREYTPSIRPEYGYGIYDNVVTSIEYERYLSASGPTGGHILRNSDGREPSRIAFIQCVGSRDRVSGKHGYCSSYCCMQATKDAIITREHAPSVDSTIFYIDLRAFGKEFDKFVDRARDEYGVTYIKSRVSEIVEDPATKDLIIRYVTPDGTQRSGRFDLVVLSVGIRVPPALSSLLDRLGVETDSYGFCRTSPFGPVATSVDGIYACGTVTGPMDIPETVVSASAAAAMAAAGLVGPEISSRIEKDTPPERDVEGASMEVGVIVCRCGVNIGAVVDVPAVVEFARSLPNVTFAEELQYACSQDSIKYIVEKIKENSLSRFVVASCSPRTHEPLFRTALEEGGLNKYLLQMTNIRDQCSWVHQGAPEEATEKAKDLVRMAVGKARYLQPLYELSSSVNKACLVIGGGVAGMVAALSVADKGFKVYLLEREEEFGGNVRNVHSLLGEDCVAGALNAMVKRVCKHPLIEDMTGVEITGIDGYVGNFTTTVRHDGEGKQLEHGTVIVATGAREHATESYGYREDPYVVTQREFETMLVHDNPVLKNVQTVTMIQCVDSRDGEHNYCSRVCCGHAIRNILAFKKKYPDTSVYVLYRDIRTYGLMEQYYEQARQAGAVFIRYDSGRMPAVEKTGQGEYVVRVFDEILQQEAALGTQLLVLGVGLDPLKSNKDIATMLKVPLTEDGFFHEAHVKLRPVDFATEGVFVCGLAHGPKYVGESIAQAVAAAGRALTILTRDSITSEAHTAFVSEARCSGCALCVDVCAYGAIELNPESGVVEVNSLLCKGCGTCAATCLSGAIDLSGFSSKQLVKEFEELFLHG